MRTPIIPGLLLSALACSSSVRSAPEPANSPATSPAAASSPAQDSAGRITIRIPPRVAAFRMGSRRDYEDRSLGTQLRYLGPDSLLADVYVYPGPGFDEKCDSACAVQFFEREMAQFQSDFPEMVRRRYYDSITVAAENSHAPGMGRPWRVGRHLRLAVVHGGKPARSDFHLFYLPGYRVKVRLTYDPTAARERAVDAFMRDLLPRLVGSPASAPPSRAPAPSLLTMAAP